VARERLRHIERIDRAYSALGFKGLRGTVTQGFTLGYDGGAPLGLGSCLVIRDSLYVRRSSGVPGPPSWRFGSRSKKMYGFECVESPCMEPDRNQVAVVGKRLRHPERMDRAYSALGFREYSNPGFHPGL
jgi:hypothetical protein